jgi:hypothetical protein
VNQMAKSMSTTPMMMMMMMMVMIVAALAMGGAGVAAQAWRDSADEHGIVDLNGAWRVEGLPIAHTRIVPCVCVCVCVGVGRRQL